ncbi:hypothetical protein, partial [uncultured Alistipes sp.]|uniref:hypothetical protein n=1 Tax=uncultured Alistipes sp. TaxID=538949 RepID=UPI00260BE827
GATEFVAETSEVRLFFYFLFSFPNILCGLRLLRAARAAALGRKVAQTAARRRKPPGLPAATF